MKDRAFVIHLTRAERRGAHVRALLPQLSLSAEILEAVDGLALPVERIAEVYRRELHRPRYPFELRPQEIGCFLSHRKAWAAIVDRDLDAGLVIEDDVEIDAAAFAPLLDFARAHAGPIDYLRFPRWTRGEQGPVVAHGGKLSLIAPVLPGLGMQMQWVGQEAAASLLAATETFDRPVDTFLQMHWLHGARMLAARPICIREIDDRLGGSVIQKTRKPLGEILSREIKRSNYRLSLAARNWVRRNRG